MTPARRLPDVAADVEFADFETEIVALVPGVRRAVHLEAGHAIVLDSCRRGDTVDRVVDDITRASGQERSTVETWVGETVRELARLGLVVPGGVTDEPLRVDEDGPS